MLQIYEFHYLLNSIRNQVGLEFLLSQGRTASVMDSEQTVSHLAASTPHHLQLVLSELMAQYVGLIESQFGFCGTSLLSQVGAGPGAGVGPGAAVVVVVVTGAAVATTTGGT